MDEMMEMIPFLRAGVALGPFTLIDLLSDMRNERMFVFFVNLVLLASSSCLLSMLVGRISTFFVS